MAWGSPNYLLVCCVRLQDNIGRICFYPTARYFQVVQLH